MILLISSILLVVNALVYLLKYKFIFRPSKIIPQLVIDLQYEEINISVNKDSINILHFPKENCKNLFIFSHGTSGNLYHRIKHVKNIMNDLDTSVVLYDYRGYGNSKGKCSEKNIYADIEIVYNFMLSKYKADNIILYGSSLGTIATIYLASRVNCKAVILHSPFLSLRQIIPWYIRYFIYFSVNDFNMTEKIKSIMNPTLIFHSIDDNVIPYRHSTRIFNMLTVKKKLIVPVYGRHGEVKVTNLLPIIKYFIDY